MSVRRVVVWALYALFISFTFWMLLLRAERRGDPLWLVVGVLVLIATLHVLDVRERSKRDAADRDSRRSEDDT